MKNKIIKCVYLLLIVVLITSCSASPATSLPATATPDLSPFIPTAIPGEVVYVPYPVEITIDGALSDWNEIPVNIVETGPTPASDLAENGSFTFSVAADLDNFYITMQMPDKNIIAGQHGVEFWNEDSMEFYINTTEDLNSSTYKPGMFQININAADIGNTDPKNLHITGVFSTGLPVSGFVFKTENGWGFEAALPLAGLIVPAHGKEIGFQAQINGATKQDRDVKLIWSKLDTTDQSWEHPQLFGRALFFEVGRKDIPQASMVLALPTPTVETQAVIPELISVNQTGYFISGPKIALIALESENPQDWSLQNADGDILLSGKTKIAGRDITSADFLQSVDFSGFTTAGDGYQVVSNGLKSVSFSISNELYNQLPVDAMAYFYHNRSGTPIEVKYVGEQWARLAGHLTDNNVTCFEGKDAEGQKWSGCDYALDVAGGWYDAGDFGKYVVNGGISVWTLMDLYEQLPEVFPDGSLSIPEQANGVPDVLDEARWEMEFLLSMQVPQGEPQAGMVHHKMHDESWAAMPMVPPSEVDNDNKNKDKSKGRYLFPPSTAATLNLAASGAVCARIWKSIDPAFSQNCLTAAETAWDAAIANPAIFAGNTPGQGGGNYEDQVVNDEFYWAAAELFITTGQEEYKTYLLSSDQLGSVDAFDWGHTASLGTISLVSTKNTLPEDKIKELKNNIIAYSGELIDRQKRDGYSVLIEGSYPWGSNGLILNNMMLMGLAYKLSGESKYLDSMILCMDYIMGRNPVNTSYVSGYGTYYMQHPHHRFWANDPSNGYPPPPAGAIAGGPNAAPSDPVALNADLVSLGESKRYIDEIGSYSTNEVTINWNAPLVWVSTFLNQIMK